MLRNDYIMRIIEQLGIVLARVLKLGDTGQFQEALAALNQACREFSGLDTGLILALDDEYLLQILSLHGVLDTDKAIILANLLLAEGDLYASQGQEDEAAFRYVKSLDLLLAASLVGVDGRFEALPAQVPALLAKLQDYQLPELTRLRLFAAYERLGEYARAEDVYFDLLEGSHYSRRAVRAGIAFYRRLLALDDAALAAGNLPRPEVAESLDELLAAPPSRPWRRRYAIVPADRLGDIAGRRQR